MTWAMIRNKQQTAGPLDELDKEFQARDVAYEEELPSRAVELDPQSPLTPKNSGEHERDTQEDDPVP